MTRKLLLVVTLLFPLLAHARSQNVFDDLMIFGMLGAWCILLIGILLMIPALLTTPKFSGKYFFWIQYIVLLLTLLTIWLSFSFDYEYSLIFYSIGVVLGFILQCLGISSACRSGHFAKIFLIAASFLSFAWVICFYCPINALMLMRITMGIDEILRLLVCPLIWIVGLTIGVIHYKKLSRALKTNLDKT